MREALAKIAVALDCCLVFQYWTERRLSKIGKLISQRAPLMRLPFIDPPQDKVVAVATDLIERPRGP
jgi:hypothetical protein